jgi:hypothetical protein
LQNEVKNCTVGFVEARAYSCRPLKKGVNFLMAGQRSAVKVWGLQVAVLSEEFLPSVFEILGYVLSVWIQRVNWTSYRCRCGGLPRGFLAVQVVDKTVTQCIHGLPRCKPMFRQFFNLSK